MPTLAVFQPYQKKIKIYGHLLEQNISLVKTFMDIYGILPVI